jgi:hypothetical protein
MEGDGVAFSILMAFRQFFSGGKLDPNFPMRPAVYHVLMSGAPAHPAHPNLVEASIPMQKDGCHDG